MPLRQEFIHCIFFKAEQYKRTFMTQANNDRLKLASLWLFAIGCSSILNVASADLPTGEDVLNRLGIPQAQLGDLNQGKPITWKYPENSDKELAVGVAIYLPTPLSKVIAYVKKGDFAGIDSTVTTRGTIPENVNAGTFKRFAISGDEAQELLGVEAGGKFNLSAEEIASFAGLKTSLASADKNTVAQTVSQRYREILLQRYQAYRQGGLTGIAPYARGGSDQADPSSELRTATEQGNLLVKIAFPELYQAWLNYPQTLPADAKEEFSWQNRVVEDRPTATLTHSLIQTSDSGAVIVVRQFYVGHSYNSSQLLAGCLPYREGAIVFYALRSSTDQVAGMGSGLKHSIGRDRMKAEMVKQLQRLRTIVK